eukprot:5436865-Amphidinium_carterae.1
MNEELKRRQLSLYILKQSATLSSKPTQYTVAKGSSTGSIKGGDLFQQFAQESSKTICPMVPIVHCKQRSSPNPKTLKMG